MSIDHSDYSSQIFDNIVASLYHFSVSGGIYLVRTQNFPMNLTFLTPWYAHVRAWG